MSKKKSYQKSVKFAGAIIRKRGSKWQVEINHSDKRVRKTLPTLEEAKGYAERMKVAVANQGAGAFDLDSKERVDARQALDILEGRTTLVEAAKHWIKMNKAPDKEILVAELMEDYVHKIIPIIPSGDTLALVMHQITAGIRSMGLSAPEIRRLYELSYRAFRRRRSLLLLNLDSQIRIEEIPWIAAVDSHRTSGASDGEVALQTLKDVMRMNLRYFPQAIIPNKLLQEIRALAKTAKLKIPVVDELAADIFMGSFTSVR